MTHEARTIPGRPRRALEPAPLHPPGAPRRASGVRMLVVHALILATTAGAVIAIVFLWANSLLFSPDNWQSTSTKLLDNATVRRATATYVVDQLFANVDVEALIKSGLPKSLAPVAQPTARAIQDAAVPSVDGALATPSVQSLWADANLRADQALVAIVNGKPVGPVRANDGAVTLDLSQVVGEVGAQIGLPSALRQDLPPNATDLTVLRSDQLTFLQYVGKGVQGLALWLTILVPILYLVAIVLAPGYRRRTLIWVGCSIVAAGAIVVVGRAVLRTPIANSLVSDVSLRPAAKDVLTIATAPLNELGVALIIGGLVLAIVAAMAPVLAYPLRRAP